MSKVVTTEQPMLIGLVSDTHNLLRPGIEQLFENCDVLIHAGDIGSVEVLSRLEEIAPVLAVRGNTDSSFEFDFLPYSMVVDLCGVLCYILHDISQLDVDPVASGIKVVVSGHTHMPEIIRFKDNVMYINPGSAGPDRVGCPVALALMSIEDKIVSASIVEFGS